MATLVFLIAFAFAGVRGESVLFGSDRAPVGHVMAVDAIQPYDFYTQFVTANKPLLIRGAMKNATPVTQWSDAYLTSRHGHSSVDVDMTKQEQRGSPSMYVTLREFLSWYQREEAYLISTLPDSLQREFPLPSCLNCEVFRTKLQVGKK